MVSRLSAVICLLLRRVWHLYHVLIISFGSFQYYKMCFKLSKYWLWGTKCLKYSVNMLLTCTLYDDARPGYFISLIRTVCKYRKCSFLTGLITSLTDLLQTYHQGQIGTSKTKSTGSPVPALISLLSEFFCFALVQIFFRPHQELVCRIQWNIFMVVSLT